MTAPLRSTESLHHFFLYLLHFSRKEKQVFFNSQQKAKSRLLNSRIANLRKVTIYWEPMGKESTPAVFFVHKKHVDRFVKAAIRLHVDPGINPHSGGTTVRVVRIKVASPDPGFYWWATPDLMNNHDYEKGAAIFDFFTSTSTTVWEAVKESPSLD